MTRKGHAWVLEILRRRKPWLAPKPIPNAVRFWKSSALGQLELAEQDWRYFAHPYAEVDFGLGVPYAREGRQRRHSSLLERILYFALLRTRGILLIAMPN